MSKKGTVAKVALGTAAVLAVVGNKACDFAIKRPDPLKEKKPETREVYIKRAEIRQRNNRNFLDCNPEDLSLTAINGDNMRAWYLPAEKKSNSRGPEPPRYREWEMHRPEQWLHPKGVHEGSGAVKVRRKQRRR